MQTNNVQPCEATEISFGNIKKESFPVIYERICKAFPNPATGCIPMVMFPEIRNYHKMKDLMSAGEITSLSAKITKDFQKKGNIPGPYKIMWSTYLKRLRIYQNRRSTLAQKYLSARPN